MEITDQVAITLRLWLGNFFHNDFVDAVVFVIIVDILVDIIVIKMLVKIVTITFSFST